MQGKLNFENAREAILNGYNEQRIASTASGSTNPRDNMNARGDGLKEMIKPVDDLKVRTFNDKNEFDCECDPGVVFEDLQEFNINFAEEKL